MTDKLSWIDDELKTLKDTGFYNSIARSIPRRVPSWWWTAKKC